MSLLKCLFICKSVIRHILVPVGISDLNLRFRLVGCFNLKLVGCCKLYLVLWLWLRKSMTILPSTGLKGSKNVSDIKFFETVINISIRKLMVTFIRTFLLVARNILDMFQWKYINGVLLHMSFFFWFFPLRQCARKGEKLTCQQTFSDGGNDSQALTQFPSQSPRQEKVLPQANMQYVTALFSSFALMTLCSYLILALLCIIVWAF